MNTQKKELFPLAEVSNLDALVLFHKFFPESQTGLYCSGNPMTEWEVKVRFKTVFDDNKQRMHRGLSLLVSFNSYEQRYEVYWRDSETGNSGTEHFTDFSKAMIWLVFSPMYKGYQTAKSYNLLAVA